MKSIYDLKALIIYKKTKSVKSKISGDFVPNFNAWHADNMEIYF